MCFIDVAAANGLTHEACAGDVEAATGIDGSMSSAISKATNRSSIFGCEFRIIVCLYCTLTWHSPLPSQQHRL